jgi:hypothetical protein
MEGLASTKTDDPPPPPSKRRIEVVAMLPNKREKDNMVICKDGMVALRMAKTQRMKIAVASKVVWNGICVYANNACCGETIGGFVLVSAKTKATEKPRTKKHTTLLT